VKIGIEVVERVGLRSLGRWSAFVRERKKEKYVRVS
jgi:hypothetical protein